MTADQILTAFRFIAMGRPNHPEVVALAEYLAAPSDPLSDLIRKAREGDPSVLVTEDRFFPASGLSQVIAEEVQDKPKRGRKKAE